MNKRYGYYKFKIVYKNGATEVKKCKISSYKAAKNLSENMRRRGSVRQVYFSEITRGEYLEHKQNDINSNRPIDVNLELEKKIIGGNLRSVEDLDYVYIYALVAEDRVVYIGQSVHPVKRVKQHFDDSKKMFEKWTVVDRVLQQDADKIEQFYIKQLKPIYNVVHNKGSFQRQVKNWQRGY